MGETVAKMANKFTEVIQLNNKLPHVKYEYVKKPSIH